MEQLRSVEIYLWLFSWFFILSNSVGEKNSKLSNKEAYVELKKTIASVKASCGDVCDQTILGKHGKYFDEITKNIECLGLFSNINIDLPSQFKEAPSKIPKWLRDDFSYNGKVKLFEDYRDNSKGQDHFHFTNQVIQKIQKELDNNTFVGKFKTKSQTHLSISKL